MVTVDCKKEVFFTKALQVVKSLAKESGTNGNIRKGKALQDKPLRGAAVTGADLVSQTT